MSIFVYIFKSQYCVIVAFPGKTRLRIINGSGLICLFFTDSQNAAFELLMWCI